VAIARHALLILSSPTTGKKGVWKRLFALGENSDLAYLIIVRARQHAAGQKGDSEDEAIGRSGDGLSTKISIATDAPR